MMRLCGIKYLLFKKKTYMQVSPTYFCYYVWCETEYVFRTYPERSFVGESVSIILEKGVKKEGGCTDNNA